MAAHPTGRRDQGADSLEERRRALLEGHRRNPLTTTPTGGRVLSALMLPWFLLLPPSGFGVLTTTGRRTGQARRRCVRAMCRGGRVYLVSIAGNEAAWIKNIRSNPRVGLRLKGGRWEGMAREIVDPSELADAREAFCGTVNLADRGEFFLHMRGRPSRSRIRELHQRWFRLGTPVVIELRQ